VRWVWSRLWSFQVEDALTTASEDASFELTSQHRAIVDELMCHDEPDTAARLLAPLDVGDRLPWKLDRNREPQWLTVIEVVSDVSYMIRYPDGTTELLVDSE